jgi:hypothetical protein
MLTRTAERNCKLNIPGSPKLYESARAIVSMFSSTDPHRDPGTEAIVYAILVGAELVAQHQTRAG